MPMTKGQMMPLVLRLVLHRRLRVLPPHLPPLNLIQLHKLRIHFLTQTHPHPHHQHQQQHPHHRQPLLTRNPYQYRLLLLFQDLIHPYYSRLMISSLDQKIIAVTTIESKNNSTTLAGKFHSIDETEARERSNLSDTSLG